ncbi:MAG: hypothetical protein JW800_02890 [Candidatus Omnitrophica bacterium]|nr:hypothetical protein [Candidatus Omnitrophota bacterium]
MLISFLSVLLFESCIAFMIHIPSCIRFPFDNFISNIYILVFRNIIQYDSSCAKYDPTLTYTLRPGTCTFSNVEYGNVFHINSLGVRDDEDSLEVPAVIVIGDSEAMGWGVDQDETYAQIIENASGMRVLNAAVSSYGTVREMRMLNRIDASRLRYLIIHYDKNDSLENFQFYSRRNTLDIMPEEAYETLKARYERWKRYYPGKFTLLFVKSIIKGTAFDKFDFMETEGLSAIPPGMEAKIFLNAIINTSHPPLDKAEVIVVGEKDFLSSLKEEARSPDYPEYVRNISTVNCEPMLDSSCYYALDDHLNAKGHKIIAQAILDLLNNTYLNLI